LEVDAANTALNTLSTKIEARKKHIEELDRKRREREERVAAEAATLKLALKQRNIPNRTTDKAPELEDAVMKLADPLDAKSTLTIPVVLLYPLHLQSDFIKAFAETESLLEHLSYILPLPWDEKSEYSTDTADCYIETIVGGLIKAGKKLPLRKILESGKVEIADGLLRINVVPKARAQEWIDDFKAKKGKT
jgi:Cns1/TTC4 Wheel domain